MRFHEIDVEDRMGVIVSEARADNLVSRQVTGVKRHRIAFEFIALNGTPTLSTSI